MKSAGAAGPEDIGRPLRRDPEIGFVQRRTVVGQVGDIKDIETLSPDLKLHALPVERDNLGQPQILRIEAVREGKIRRESDGQNSETVRVSLARVVAVELVDQFGQLPFAGTDVQLVVSDARDGLASQHVLATRQAAVAV